MLDLVTRLSGGKLADFTRAIRARKPDDWDGDVFALPEMELTEIIISSARVASFFEDGQAPTDGQIYAMDYDERIELAGDVMELFNHWNKRQFVSEEEKKSSSKPQPDA